MPRPTPRRISLAVLAVAALPVLGLAAVGCGSSDDAGQATTSSQQLSDAQKTALRPAYRADVKAAQAVVGPDADTTDLAALATNARAWQKAGEAWTAALDSVADELGDGPCHDALRTVAFAQAAEDAIIGNIADAAAAGQAADAASHLEDYAAVRKSEHTEEVVQDVKGDLTACGANVTAD